MYPHEQLHFALLSQNSAGMLWQLVLASPKSNGEIKGVIFLSRLRTAAAGETASAWGDNAQLAAEQTLEIMFASVTPDRTKRALVGCLQEFLKKDALLSGETNRIRQKDAVRFPLKHYAPYRAACDDRIRHITLMSRALEYVACSVAASELLDTEPVAV